MENLSEDNYNYVPEDITSKLMVQIMFCLFYIIIFVLGIFGNALVVFVVSRNRQMHTVTNLFITNLALSDVLLCILAVPFTPLYTFLGGWVFGKTLCHLVPYAQSVSVYVSTLTLTSIAADRYHVILYPFHPRMKVTTCLAIILAIWMIALLLTLPYGLYVHLVEETYVSFCEENWPSEQFRKIFSCLTSILQFAVPFMAITFCYICVSIKLNEQARAKPGTKSGKREENDRERKRRTNRMLIAMVAVFGISWLPLNFVNIVDDFYSYASDWSYYRFSFFMAHCIAMSSTCYNPFLYAWLNDNFRKEFKQILPCYSRNSNTNAPKTKKSRRGEKFCNGSNTLQETLLASNTKTQNPEMRESGCEMIILEQTTNISKELDQPTCSSKDFDEATL
ncbi:PREDICTED: prolactin-releasing peptide receptor-like [Cyphomyrmex costatus]|uniref:Prolactin-releasing peptide receptor n=1 Tax=Cyphomyrmex costatus TaxID=456900 RepID=A0A195C3U0_9HYME|nr:PREDICTED: prolactin-releasing peptide receptor-like [Cyphomyrmex costatus]KYM95529.1 Prolactin-releasing peptide receptor [Cyphomyrmex costatus]